MLDRVKQRFLQRLMTGSLGMYKEIPSDKGTDHPAGELKDSKKRAAYLLSQMSTDERIAYISGVDDLAIRAIDRLGIPKVYCSDATSGVRCFGPATSFPAAIAFAATFDVELIEQVGRAIADQALARGVSILLAPGVNLARTPVCGRNFEYMGEDPLLAGSIASAYIRGVQSKGVITTVKHFACNESEYDRHRSNSVIDERVLHELYLTPFRMAVREAGSGGVMSAYNQINGRYASEHDYLLEQVLREQWGFDGFVISDWNSLYSTEGPIRAGLDLEMPKARWLSEKRVRKALSSGSITMEMIDSMVFDLLHTLIRFGVFDRPAVAEEPAYSYISAAEIASRCAEEAIILLKNDEGLLPLEPRGIENIVILGPNGLKTATGGGGSSYMIPKEVVSIYDQARNAYPASNVTYIETRRGNIHPRDRAEVASADVVIVAAGFDHVSESEGYDRSWELPSGQSRLIRQAASLNGSVIVLLLGGGAMECAGWIGDVKAVLHGLYLGENTSSALLDVITGKVNPSGRLPFTMGCRLEDYPSMMGERRKREKMSLLRVYGPQGRRWPRKVQDELYHEGFDVGYRGFDHLGTKPLFPFGFGLSYTTFTVTEPRVMNHDQQLGCTVTCRVTNTGPVSGAYVLQLYVHALNSSVYRPEKELKGFSKVYLDPGESREVSIDLAEAAFAFYDPETSSWLTEPGEFELLLADDATSVVHRLSYHHLAQLLNE